MRTNMKIKMIIKITSIRKNLIEETKHLIREKTNQEKAKKFISKTMT
jgi:hypothetical protein